MAGYHFGSISATIKLLCFSDKLYFDGLYVLLYHQEKKTNSSIPVINLKDVKLTLSSCSFCMPDSRREGNVIKFFRTNLIAALQ